jgi:hypothetical protein
MNPVRIAGIAAVAIVFASCVDLLSARIKPEYMNMQVTKIMPKPRIIMSLVLLKLLLLSFSSL